MMRSWKRKFDWSFRVISFLLMKTNSNWFLTLSERSDELFRRRQCTCMHGGENLKALLLSTSQLCLSHQFSWFSVRINPICSNQKQYKFFIYSFLKITNSRRITSRFFNNSDSLKTVQNVTILVFATFCQISPSKHLKIRVQHIPISHQMWHLQRSINSTLIVNYRIHSGRFVNQSSSSRFA